MANRALLVGINAYPTQPLLGCVNDIVDSAQFLIQKCGFADADIWHLTDADATADAIRERIASWLVAPAQAGDRICFHYSGHGARLNYTDGAVHDVICPVDFAFSAPRAIADFEFAGLFAGLPQGVRFNWISDSCHSGDLALLTTTLLDSPRRGIAKILEPPAAVASAIQALLAAGAPQTRLRSAAQGLNGALIAACRSDQLSFDSVFDGRPNGVLTHYLLERLAAADGLGRSLTAAVADASASIQAAHWGQSPQLHGSPGICAAGFLGGAAGV